MSCEDCGQALSHEAFCLRCYPTYTKKAYRWLVDGAGRTTSNSLDCAIAAAPPSTPLWFTAIFSPGGGNGPYFADYDVDVLVKRIAASWQKRMATIFRRGRPCYLHLDIDDNRPEAARPPIRKVMETVISLVSEVMRKLCGVAPGTTDWLLSQVEETADAKKSSGHCSALSCVFSDVTQVGNLTSSITWWTRASTTPTLC